MSLRSVLRSAIANPGDVLRRGVGHVRTKTLGASIRAQEWAQTSAVEAGSICAALDSELWDESIDFAIEMRRYAAERAEALRAERGFWLGGAGDYRLLYFVVRYTKPAIVVETGVALGYSSRSILLAMRANGFGRLYSSDMPYPRIDDAESLVGLLVDHSLRDNWTLLLGADRRNLPRIRDLVGDQTIGLLHYDSDKSEKGRSFALSVLSPCIGPETVVIVDDVNDNLWFRDWTSSWGLAADVVSFVEEWPKYIGIANLEQRSR